MHVIVNQYKMYPNKLTGWNSIYCFRLFINCYEIMKLKPLQFKPIDAIDKESNKTDQWIRKTEVTHIRKEQGKWDRRSYYQIPPHINDKFFVVTKSSGKQKSFWAGQQQLWKYQQRLWLNEFVELTNIECSINKPITMIKNYCEPT